MGRARRWTKRLPRCLKARTKDFLSLVTRPKPTRRRQRKRIRKQKRHLKRRSRMQTRASQTSREKNQQQKKRKRTTLGIKERVRLGEGETTIVARDDAMTRTRRSRPSRIAIVQVGVSVIERIVIEIVSGTLRRSIATACANLRGTRRSALGI